MKTIFAILLMCFTGFAFAENERVFAGPAIEIKELAPPDEGGMGEEEAGEEDAVLGQDPGAMGDEGAGEAQWEADEDEEQPE